MKLRQLHESVSSELGHIAWDVAGFVPGAGEIADIAHALHYYNKKDYITASLYIISCIPDVGDIIGKGLKYLGKSSKTIAKIAPHIQKHLPRIQRAIKELARNEGVRRVVANRKDIDPEEFWSAILTGIEELAGQANT